MKVLSIINLKGGVGKTVSTVNLAYELARACKGKVLVVDLDHQANASKFLRAHDPELPGISELLTGQKEIRQVIRPAGVPCMAKAGVDVIPSNMSLLTADRQVLLDMTRPQHNRLAQSLEQVDGRYCFVLLDNAPGLSMATLNGLVAADDVLIPVSIDEFALDGLRELTDQVGSVRRNYNPKLRVAGCFITMWQNTLVQRAGSEALQQSGYPCFAARIRASTKVRESTFRHLPMAEYQPRGWPAQDYRALAEEYMNIPAGGREDG